MLLLYNHSRRQHHYSRYPYLSCSLQIFALVRERASKSMPANTGVQGLLQSALWKGQSYFFINQCVQHIPNPTPGIIAECVKALFWLNAFQYRSEALMVRIVLMVRSRVRRCPIRSITYNAKNVLLPWS